MEAMSCGLPVFYSNSGGLPELVSKDCGVGLQVRETWNKGDVIPKYSDIADGMIKIYENRKKFSKMQEILQLKNLILNFGLKDIKLYLKV